MSERVRIVVDDALVAEAIRLGEPARPREAIEAALQEYVARQRSRPAPRLSPRG
jgi:Arc/MetJ family transcription regulator